MINCLPQKYADAFKEALKSGKINPDKLMKMTTEQRRTYFASFVGNKQAKFINTEFESKLLLINQKRGLVTWAKRMSGMRKYAQKDIINKINKLDRALNPAEEEQFLADIAEKRLGVQIGYDEAQKLLKLTEKANNLYKPDLPNHEQSREWARARQKVDRFVRDELSRPTVPINKSEFAGKVIEEAVGVSRSIITGIDISASGRQGRVYFGTKEWNNAFRDQFKYLRNQKSLDELEVDMVLSKYSDQLKIVKRDLGLTLLGDTMRQREEQFASKLVSKIPGLQQSERAYVGFLNDLRFHKFENELAKWDKMGRTDLLDDKKALKDLAKVISASTGRGYLPGGLEKSANALATALFSPRWIASRVEVLLGPVTAGTHEAKNQAIKDLAFLIGTTAGLLLLAKMGGADVELDTRSTDFGKARWKDTRVDLSGGLASYITFMSRIQAQSYKSSTDGTVKLLNSGGYNSLTVWDMAESFVTNKAAPVPRLFIDLMKGETFEGEPFNFDDKEGSKEAVKYIAQNLFIPLIGQDAYEAYTEGSGGSIVATGSVLANLTGWSSSTYKPYPKQEVRRLYQDDNEQDARDLLDAYIETGAISKNSAKTIKKEWDLPNDVVYFKNLSKVAEIKYLKKVKLNDLHRYYWYSSEETKDNFGDISKDAEEFMKLKNQGEIKKPSWDKGIQK